MHLHQRTVHDACRRPDLVEVALSYYLNSLRIIPVGLMSKNELATLSIFFVRGIDQYSLNLIDAWILDFNIVEVNF